MLQKTKFLLFSHILSASQWLYNKQIPTQKSKTIKNYVKRERERERLVTTRDQ